MKIELVLDQRQLRRWHSHLFQQLTAIPDVRLQVTTENAPPLPVVANTLFHLERLIYGIGHTYAMEPLSDRSSIVQTATAATPTDLVVDVTGRADPRKGVPVLRVTCNGVAPEIGAVDAVVSQAAPVVSVDLLEKDSVRPLLRWAVAVEDHRVVTRALDNILGRVVQAVCRAVTAIGSGEVLEQGPEADASPPRAAPASSVQMLPFVVAALQGKVRNRINRLVRDAPDWHTGWRAVGAADQPVPELRGRTYQRLLDDGKRFYADPFLWTRDGRDYLFVEEFPYATSRGIISAVELVAGRALGRPRPVLETNCHLSYPFLIEHQGTTYMIPETSGRRTVELWRCLSFPDVWELDRVLIQDEVLADATVVRQHDSWYLLAAQSQQWTSSWDALSVWRAPSLFGPWSAHPHNPVVVDVATARPAGTMFGGQGQLVRPAQDCSRAYGSGLTFATVDLLTPERYQQSVVQQVAPRAPLSGIHTYNRVGTLEVVDVFGTSDGPQFVL